MQYNTGNRSVLDFAECHVAFKFTYPAGYLNAKYPKQRTCTRTNPCPKTIRIH